MSLITQFKVGVFRISLATMVVMGSHVLAQAPAGTTPSSTGSLRVVSSNIQFFRVEAGVTVTRAVAVISPTKGQKANGIVTFEKTPSGIHVQAFIQQLSAGKHGFHIHQYGDIRSADGSKAGGHFNPDGHQHGSASTDMRHQGDLGNLIANDKQEATFDAIIPGLSLEGKNSVIGRSVIIHEKEDDFKTQPTGASGTRIGQGVIGISQ